MNRHRTLLPLYLLAALVVLAFLWLPRWLDEGKVPDPLADDGPAGAVVHAGELPPLDVAEEDRTESGEPREARREVAVGPPTATGPPRPRRRIPRGVVLHAHTGRPLPGLSFTVSESAPWLEKSRRAQVRTDDEGRFELTHFPRTNTLTFEDASLAEVHGYQVFELEPRTIRIPEAEELVLHAHPPALVLHLSAQEPDGSAVSKPRFWIQTEENGTRTRASVRERLEGSWDESREVLTVSFLPSQLSSEFLLVGIEGGQIYTEQSIRGRSEWSRGVSGRARVIHRDTGREGREEVFEFVGQDWVFPERSGDPCLLIASPVQIGGRRGEHHHVFPLEPAAVLRVTVLDADQEPADGVLVLVDGDPSRDGRTYPFPRRVGVQSFDAMKPGLHDILVVDSFSPAVELASESVVLKAGEATKLLIELPAESRRRLAVSGTVVSKSGTPISQVELRVSIEGGHGRSLKTDGDGRFEVWTNFEASRLTVRPVENLWRSRFDPTVIECASGATDLRFTRMKANIARFRLYFTDELTGQAIRGFRHVTLHFEGVAPARSGFQFVLSNDPHRDPFLSAPYSVRDDLRWIARVPHYRTEVGSIPAPAQRGEIVEITVPLTRGYEEELCVVTAGSRAPIAGATVTDDRGHELGRTDGNGRVTLRTDEWPEGLRVEAPGFHRAAWQLDREGLTAHWDGEVRLRPR